MMRRTYRSKKDTGGALDHRDMLLNMDEKTSAFDAYYIHNLKQTKRELSCVASSNPVGIASNKVRKRKYVKRLVKDAEPVRTRETMSTSAYLTPDKSIRVNKILDPFDMLLNSSPALHESYKLEKVQANVPQKENKIYMRKRKPKIKKFNYSSTDSTESDKENTTDPNRTDIKAHELLVEKVSNDSPAHVDESINKIVGKLSLLNNLKHKGSLNTSYKMRNRLTKNYSPLMQKSPLCSTPFKEKYRGVSIFKFSPISQKEQMSPTSEEKDDSNHSIILVSKSRLPKSSNDNKLSPLVLMSNTTKNDISINNGITNVTNLGKCGVKEESQTEMKNNDNENHSHHSCSNNEENSCQVTEMEPFLGFSNNGQDLATDKLKSILINLENQPIQNTDLDENKLDRQLLSTENAQSHINNNENVLLLSRTSIYETQIKNINTEKNELRIEDRIPHDFNNIHSDGNKSIAVKTNSDDNHQENSFLCDCVTKNILSNIDVDETKHELEISVNEKSNTNNNISCVSIQCNNITDSTVQSRSSTCESLYDTCDSDNSVLENDEPSGTPDDDTLGQPIVSIERMNDSIFLKYYEKMLKTQDEDLNKLTDDDDFESLANDSNEETISEKTKSNSYSDKNKINPIVITDSSTTDDVVSADDYINGDDYDEDSDKYVSFVTTRRKNEITKDSMFQFNESYGSSNTDCDKTVLSNKINIENFNINREIENTPVSSLNGQALNVQQDCENIKTENLPHKLVPRPSRRKSGLSIKSSSLSPDTKDDLKSESSAEDRISISSHRGPKSFTKNAKSMTKSMLKSKPSGNPSNSRISRVTTRRSRYSKNSYSTSSEINSENEVSLRESFGANESVIENKISKNNSYDLKNRNSGSTSPMENISLMLKETVVCHPERASYAGAEVKSAIVLQPGKKWERSLSIYRRMTVVDDQFDQSILESECKQNKGRKYRQSVISTMEMQEHRDSLHNDSINSRRSTLIPNPGRPTIRFVKDPNFSRVSLNTTSVFDDLKGFLSEECDDTVIELSKLSIADSEREVTVLDNFHETERVTTARDYVLRRCNQTEPLLFDECYPETVLKNCHKIGEGVYGEVFLWRARDGVRVMKIVPIAGAVKVNGEHQKDFHEIISEIVIAMELSALRAPIADIERQLDEGNDIHALDLHAIENATDIFNAVLAVRCVQGPYPSRLLDLWELYDECKGSENDNPAALPPDQRYIVLELANAGQDLESFQFSSAQQAHALFQQIAFGLAVAEEAFQFEHRDLHWGNVLIAPTDQKFATFVLRGRTHRVPRRGVAATVIDYSLSRLSLPLAGDCAALYNDLATDEALFDAVGDYQFQVYRLMRDKLGNDWKNFEPYTNILWLHYTVDKMITALRYKRTNTKIHKHYIEKLKGIKNSILEYGSAVQYVLTDIDF